MSSMMSSEAGRSGPDPEAVQSIEQFASMWRHFVNERPGADTTDRPGWSVRWADSAFMFWNLILLTAPTVSPADLAARLAEARDDMRARSRPGYVCVCEEFLEPAALTALPDLVARSGLSFALTMYGMAGDFLPIPSPDHPTARFGRVTGDAELQAYADVNSLAYGIPLDAVRDAISGSALWKAGMHTYLAYDGDEPVSAAATVANDGCLFLALVATLPGARRKGFGEATVRKALHEGARATGLTRTVLHATEAGFPVYERIGYRKVATIHAYALAG